MREDVKEFIRQFNLFQALNLSKISKNKNLQSNLQPSGMTFDEFKNTRYWKFAKAMEEFDGDKLFDELVQKIEEHNPEYVLPILNRLYYWFMKDYYQGVKDTGGTPKKYIGSNLMLKFEPIINKAGSKLQRNFMRLYSLSPDEN